MTAPREPSTEEKAREQAEAIVGAWEAAEGESMREGHREALVRLIAAGLLAARREGAEEAKLVITEKMLEAAREQERQRHLKAHMDGTCEMVEAARAGGSARGWRGR